MSILDILCITITIRQQHILFSFLIAHGASAAVAVETAHAKFVDIYGLIRCILYKPRCYSTPRSCYNFIEPSRRLIITFILHFENICHTYWFARWSIAAGGTFHK